MFKINNGKNEGGPQIRLDDKTNYGYLWKYIKHQKTSITKLLKRVEGKNTVHQDKDSVRIIG